MGSDKEEKKRLKAQAKLEKKKLKAQNPRTEPEPGVFEKSESIPDEKPKVPWYKNPDWIRAIAGIASVIVGLIAIILTLYY
jgi:hypothetical protein